MKNMKLVASLLIAGFLSASTLVATAIPQGDQDSVRTESKAKHAAKKAGSTAKKGGKAAVKGTKKAGKAVGKTAKKGANKVKKAVD